MIQITTARTATTPHYRGRIILFVLTLSAPGAWGASAIVVEPETTRAIQGISDVERQRYFCVCDPGQGFEKRIKDDAMYDYLVHELQISFGRSLGPVKNAARRLKEDPQRPGFADLTPLTKKRVEESSERMQRDFGVNLDVAAHGAHNAFPSYMGRFKTKDSVQGHKPQYLPRNIESAAELSASVLKHNYTRFDRPRYYELVNEPHWSFFDEQHLADWHLRTMELVRQKTPEVKVGGLCMSVCYFYRNDYRSFKGIKNFIDRTDCKLDFYSFHTYDYLRWRDEDIKGRLQSGLPLEGTLDLVPNYTSITFGKEIDLVVSEHGGYIHHTPMGAFNGDYVAAEILAATPPEPNPDSWDYEMKKRSIVSFGHVSSCIANTLAFIDHPHTLKKSVPFLLVNTWNWNPKYYAGLYIPHGYTDKSRWIETELTNFFKFFRGVNGRRVKALCGDPDLQVRAFVNGSTLFVAVNNQSSQSETVTLHGITAKRATLRRLVRNADFTGNYTERTVPAPTAITLRGRESLMLVADYDHAIPEKRTVNEHVCYGNKVVVPMSEASFTIKVPHDKTIEYAQLRIGLTRPPEKRKDPIVTLNGRKLKVPLEDSAERYSDREYATTKLIPLDPTQLRAKNIVTITFPDGMEGAVGSAVIRTAVERIEN